MGFFEEQNQNSEASPQPSWEEQQAMPATGIKRWLGTGLAIAVAAGLMGYSVHEHRVAAHLAGANAHLSASLGDVQTSLNEARSQMQNLSEEVQQLQASAEASQAASEPAVSAQSAALHSAARRRVAARRKRIDPRYKKLQDELALQQRQLNATQQDLDKTRADLNNSLDSTRNDLNTSIARNHDELVALEKRGQRNYCEFDLTRSKQFQRVGPIGLSLRHANTRHKNYDLMVLLDDQQMGKKHVNLYEPLVFMTDGQSGTVQLVVNHIGKNSVHGYVSTPKYASTQATASNGQNPNPAGQTAAGDTTQNAQQTAANGGQPQLTHRPQP
jgi:uncharacterized coiled-coil protein SlyX